MRKINIVIADNNNSNAKELKDFLIAKDDIGLVHVVDNGRDVLSLVNIMDIDVVICDLFIPKIDGFGVIEGIDNMNLDNKPLIIMTSIIPGDYILKKITNTESIDGYLLKPLNNELVFQKIQNLRLNNIGYKDNKSNILNLFNQPMYNESFISVFDSCDTLCIEKDNNVVDSKDLDLEIKISNTLHKLGIPANIKGYRYLQDAIKLVIDNSSLVYALTKELYPSIATKNNTTVSKVDRAIRHAIKVVSLKGDICAMQDMFNLSIDAEKTRYKNSEFIAKISEKIKLELVSNE